MLPPEIISLIASHLSCNNKFKCLFVCREWYRAILPTLYKSLLLKKRERNGPYDTIQKRKLGEVVCELSLDDGILIGNVLENLGNMCPHITTLHFRWYCSPTEESQHNGLHHRLIRRRSKRINPNDYSCIPILSSIQSTQLQHLTLCCFGFDTSIIDASTAETLNNYSHFNEILPLIPRQLSSLTLKGILHMLRAADLDRIHAHCVRLSKLKLVGSNLLLAGDVSRINEKTPIYPAMTNISLVYPAGWTNVMNWLNSLSCRYPNICVLELQNTAPGSVIMRNYDIKVLQQSFLEFAKHHQCLEQVRLINLDLPTFDVYQFFLMPLSNLQDLTLHDRRCLDSGCLMDALKKNNSVIRLDTQLCSKSSNKPTFLQQLRLYQPFLKNLKTLNIDVMDESVDLHDLLDHCSNIKSLAITHAKIWFPKLQRPSRTAMMLEQLRLKCSHFSVEGIQRLFPCCPTLRILYIRNCHIHQGMHTEVQFNFSSMHNLKSISMMNLTFRDLFRNGQKCGHLATVFTLSPNITRCNIESGDPIQKKRRCDNVAFLLSSSDGRRQRWFNIDHSLDTFCTHFDSDLNELPPRTIGKSRMVELDAKSMQDTIATGWNPYTLRKYTIYPSIPPSYISILYHSHIEDLQLNGHKIPC